MNSADAGHFARISKKAAKARSCLQPSPQVLISCRGLDGENNALAVRYCCNCSYSPPMVMVGIVPTRYSHKLIKESGCFVINLVDKRFQEPLPIWEATASGTGINWPPWT
jgi:flavin reductase (DIM6/NTAB) family NADH-FMN oxidoreductase RutF